MRQFGKGDAFAQMILAANGRGKTSGICVNLGRMFPVLPKALRMERIGRHGQILKPALATVAARETHGITVK